MPTLTFPDNQPPQRADIFLAQGFPDISRTKIQQLFEDKDVTLMDEPIIKSHLLQPGDTIEFPPPHSLFVPLTAQKMKFDVLYEDKAFFAINKPPGIAVHPVSMGDKQVTIAHGVLGYLGEKARKIGPADRPCIVHRLDKETSGILLIAKTLKAFEKLKEAFAQRQIDKEYLAIVRGCPDLLAGSITVPIGRSPRNPLKMMVSDSGRESRTDWERVAIDEKEKIALVKCYLHTGRTHQARVHLQYLGHPVLGDTSYGYRGNYRGRILLHAHRVALRHPTTGKELQLEAPVPADMKHFRQLWS